MRGIFRRQKSQFQLHTKPYPTHFVVCQASEQFLEITWTWDSVPWVAYNSSQHLQQPQHRCPATWKTNHVFLKCSSSTWWNRWRIVGPRSPQVWRPTKPYFSSALISTVQFPVYNHQYIFHVLDELNRISVTHPSPRWNLSASRAWNLGKSISGAKTAVT